MARRDKKEPCARLRTFLMACGMRFHTMTLLGVTALASSGCHHSASPPATAQDIEAAKQEAQQEIADARREAAKDVKSAAKIGGGSARDIALAKATGRFDVAMAQADGDHKVATEKCLTLPADQQTGCTAQADADYESAKAAAKAARVSR